MTYRVLSSVIVPLACVLAAGCATSNLSSNATAFSGRLLVAVSAPQAQRIAGASRAARESDWAFDCVAPAGGAAGARQGGRSWIIASPRDTKSAAAAGESPWDIAHKLMDGQAAGPYRSLLTSLSRDAGGEVTPLAVEPDVVFEDRPGLARLYQKNESRDWPPADDAGQNLVVAEPASFHWPRGPRFGWHLDDKYTQLAGARSRVLRASLAAGVPPVRVALLDTGYSERHLANPPGLNKDASRDFTEDPLQPRPGAVDPFIGGRFNAPGHGVGVMSVLAGGEAEVPSEKFSGYLGGFPQADLVCYRISERVIHLSPVAMALAIKYAVSNRVDVISLSHGGLPSALLADAVNEAYENGTAIFAAAGDFVHFPFLGISTPHMMVYPAAFDRVVSVCGVTEDGRSYAKTPSHITPFTFRRLSEWMLRGSYGPDGLMDESIAAYTPNVPWARQTASGDPHYIKASGMGTSAATPQVAAAAALWLQYNRTNEVLRSKWRSWEKAESVYWALFDSAEKKTPEGSKTFRYYGNGILRARRALEFGVPTRLQKRREATASGAWVYLLSSLLTGRSNQPRAVSGAQGRQHLDMFGTEMAQLVHGSLELQKIMDQGQGADGRLAPAQQTALFQAMRSDPRCSKALKGFLGDVARGG